KCEVQHVPFNPLAAASMLQTRTDIERFIRVWRIVSVAFLLAAILGPWGFLPGPLKYVGDVASWLLWEVLFRPYVLVPLLVGMWLLGLRLFSVYTGWADLAKTYRLDSLRALSPSPRMAWTSGYIGGTVHQNAIKAGATTEGIVLAATFFLFRPSIPPLLLPWEVLDISHQEMKVGVLKSRVSYAVLRVEAVPDFELWVSERSFRRAGIADAAPKTNRQ
ncbi:MAG: hypothetical protein AAF809_09925, partial [Bacteroidota bacterium]